MKGKLVHIRKNMSKEQLCRVSVSDFWEIFRGFRETSPFMQSFMLLLLLLIIIINYYY